MAWHWADRRALLLLHVDSLAEHGGAAGLRDEGLLDSALARPLNLAACSALTSPRSRRPAASGWPRTTPSSMATSAPAFSPSVCFWR